MRALRRTASLALLPLALGGCGSSGGGSPTATTTTTASALAGKPPRGVLNAMADALERVDSYRMQGTETDRDGTTRVTSDVAASGDLRVRLEHAGSVATLLVVDGATYVRANRRFWLAESGPDSRIAPLLADRWIVLPPSMMGGLADTIAQSRPKNLAYCARLPTGTLTRRGTASVGGTPVVVIADKGDRPGDAPGEISIAATGRPFPLRIRQTGPTPPGGRRDPRCTSADDTTTASDLRLSRFGVPVHLTAPPDAVDPRDLRPAGTTA
jgi:hypothetical protein